MTRYFTQDWFYRAFLHPNCVVRCFFWGVAVLTEADFSPEMKELLNSGAERLRIRMEARLFDSSCGVALFDETGEILRAFDVEESATACAAFVQFLQERRGMGLASYWHRNLNRDTPGYRPLNSRETALVRQTLSRRPYGAWAFRSSREALETLDSLAAQIADGLDKPDKRDPAALDWLNCVSEVKRKILIYGLPSIAEENMFYGLEISQLGLGLNLYHIRISYNSPLGDVIPSRNKAAEPVVRKHFSTVFYGEMPYVSCAEYARRGGVSEEAVLQWIQRGEIRAAVPDGKEWKVPADSPLPDGAFTAQTYLVTDTPPLSEGIGGYLFLSLLSPGQSFRICENADGNYAVIPAPCGKSKGEGNALAVFSREERERFEFYLLRSEWVAYEVPKYLLPVENRAQQAES